MGFRTVVILVNDQAHEWQNDVDLGKKIMSAASASSKHEFEYGKIVECCHADQQTMGILDSYSFAPLGYDFWYRDETEQETKVKLLKKAAADLGYRIVKKT